MRRWLEVRSVLESACEMSGPEREAYLARVCGDDAALRAEIDSILESSERSPDFLEGPAVQAFPDLFEPAEAASMIGRRFGVYELRRLIACGGMGAVYLAARVDDQYEKDVALKLINRPVATPETIARFRGERQALAMLDHPNIARLLDGGLTDAGLPFLVMEYVDGVSIDRYCDERSLSIIQRLRLFRDVLTGVSYAHQKLVVHRDLKPGNILVTSDGVPKLLDFGIAKVLNGGPRDPTRTSARIMTPEYASPEQIRGEPVTTASDVYSLGVILFELLTGHRPYRLKSSVPHEIERTICEEDPERPSTAVRRVETVTHADGTTGTLTPQLVSRTREGRPERLQRRLAGDLDEIILMALRKQPESRYASVEQFSDDIARHLGGEPVRARRGSFAYHGVKFVRRHRAGIMAATLICLLLVGGIVTTAWQGRAARDEAQKVQRVNSFLTGMMASLDTNTGREPKSAFMDVLDEAARSIDDGALGGQWQVEADLRLTIGMTYLQLGALGSAEEHLQAAHEIRRRKYGDRHRLVAETHNSLGLLAKAAGRYESAESAYRTALELRRATTGPRSAECAETLNNLGVLLKTTGRLEDAERCLREALEIRQAALAALEADDRARPADLRGRRVDVATSLTNLAAALKVQGLYEPAEELYRRAQTLFRQTLGDDHYRVAVCQNNLALLLTATGRFDEAETRYRDALAIRRKVFGDEHRAVATGLKNLALLLTTTGRFAEAEPLYREALAIERRLPGDEQRLANTANNLADLLVTLGDLEAAEELCREAMSTRRREDPNHRRLAGSLLVLGRIHMARGELLEAEAALRDALDRYPAGTPPATIARARSELGDCLVALGRFDEAQRLLLSAWSARDDAAPIQARETRRRIIQLYEAWGRPEDAAPYREIDL